ncbi:MAG TPA: hypothetical protein VGA76_05605 [Candidatus Dormibacteraeota bacterium]
MTRVSRPLALLVLAAITVVSCTRLGSSSSNAQLADIVAAGPTVSDVRSMLGDSNWWQGPPTFEVRPLNAETTPRAVRFGMTQQFIHIGTAEGFLVHYTVYETTTAATTRMTNLPNQLGPAQATSPKVGDQVMYYGETGPSGAPYLARTFVRLGEIIVEVTWARKDGVASLTQLGKNASKIVDGLKKAIAAKTHRSLQVVDQKLLPPPELDITFLGAAPLPIEAFLVMGDYAIPGPLAKELHGHGVDTFVFGDYVLNGDTHMEVQAALMTFASHADATGWLGAYSGGQPDQSGVVSSYLDAIGKYRYSFTSGVYGAMLVCRSTVPGEAASRACEQPLSRTVISWGQGLAG